MRRPIRCRKHLRCGSGAAMLVRMQSSAAPAQSSPRPPGFAGVLMDIAVPEGKKPPVRDFDGLEDDVAVLSYENAVRLHGRYRSGEARPQLVRDAVPDLPAAAEAVLPAPSPLLDRRSASITVRLCPTESERLRQRAAESGLTISEYLRSCVFEVESLRAQVKEALAALRATEKTRTVRPWWQRWWMLRRDANTAA